MRTWIRICFTLSIVLAVAAGCGAAEQEPVSAQQGEQSAAGGAGQQASVEEHVELTYFSWNPATDEMNRRLIAQFEAMYPHVKIVYQSY
jgi:ABC-type glycerol-3-phosphate transport system substrate-binding protein